MNDPVAILLVIGFVEWIEQPDYGVFDMALLFVRQLGIGLVAGLLVGWLAVQGLRRARLDTAGLYPVATLATAALAYGAADTLEGSGFLAAYLAGLMLGSAPIPAKRTVTVFHEGLGWLAQISLFVVLGLLVFPSDLPEVALEGTALALVLLLVARPLSVFVATAFDRFSTVDRLVLGWAGLRGAVPVVLATFPVIAEVPQSTEFFNIVFFAVVISTLVQGVSFEPFARAVGVTTSEPALPRPLAETGTIRRLGAEIVEFPVGPEDAIVGQVVRDLGLPRDALLSVIVRGDEAILPRGSTRLEAGDRLHVVVRQEVADQVPKLLERWREGPIRAPAAPRIDMRASTAVFTARRWTEEDGDPGFPSRVAGVDVLDHLRTRRGRARRSGGAGGRPLRGHRAAPGRGRRGADPALRPPPPGRRDDDSARAWWQEVIGALAR